MANWWEPQPFPWHIYYQLALTLLCARPSLLGGSRTLPLFLRTSLRCSPLRAFLISNSPAEAPLVFRRGGVELRSSVPVSVSRRLSDAGSVFDAPQKSWELSSRLESCSSRSPVSRVTPSSQQRSSNVCRSIVSFLFVGFESESTGGVLP